MPIGPLTLTPPRSPLRRGREMTNDDIRSLLGVQICRALQMGHSNRITRLEIVVEAGEIPVVIVTRALFGDDCGGPLTKALERYQLTPIVSEPQAEPKDSIGQN